MLRSFLLLLITFFFPLLLFGQEEEKPRKNTTEKKDPSTFKNEVGIGVHALGFLSLLKDEPQSLNLNLQSSYKRKLEHFTLRAGIGVGKEYVYPRNFAFSNNGLIGATALMLNVGVEKAILRIAGFWEMSIGVDFVHLYRWNVKRETEHTAILIPDRSIRAAGTGLTLDNTFRLTSRSSLSIEAGIAVGRSGSITHHGEEIHELRIPLREWVFFPPYSYFYYESRQPAYRNLVLSYNYHF